VEATVTNISDATFSGEIITDFLLLHQKHLVQKLMLADIALPHIAVIHLYAVLMETGRVLVTLTCGEHKLVLFN
jgi:hypothetical protein